MTRNTLPIILLTLGTLLQITPAPLRAFSLGSDGLTSVSITAGIEPIPSDQEADLDGNGIQETLALSDERLTILSEGRIAWQSPAEWQVVQAAIVDLNQDGYPEVSLLLWRPFRAWPVDQWLPYGGRIAGFHNMEGQSCHFILIGWSGKSYQELWAGSAMADPITAFTAADLDGDGKQELVALEGRYSDPGSAPARTLKVWKWNGFGFSVVSSMDGVFSKMTLVQANDGQILILVP